MTTRCWPDILAQLLAGNDLATADTSWVMDQIMSGQATGAQFGAFTAALRAKGETVAEVNGLVAQMLAHAVVLNIDGPTLDVVGTGGDLAQTVNISTMSAIVAAAAGARVVKHGNRAASSRCGSADVLAELGIAIELPADAVAACVDQIGIGFCFAPVFHPALRHAGPHRREMGVPTVFNILGPLANPARPTSMLVGCADLTLAPVMAQVLAERGTRALVVRGLDGLDEITVFGDTQVWDVTGGGAEVNDDVIRLAELGVQAAAPSALRGGEAADNAAILRAVFAGDRRGHMQAVRDAVALNAAAALVAWDSIGAEPATVDVTARVLQTLPRAYEAIDTGQAAELLDLWIEVSNFKSSRG